MVKNRQLMEKNEPFMSARYLQCLLLCCGLTAGFAMRVNMSVAVVAMTDKNNTNPDFEEFTWDEKIKSYVLSSFFVGYVCTQVPAGYLATKYGGKFNLLVGILISSITSMLIPIGASMGGWKFVVFLRILAGISQGVIMPSMHCVLSKWSPPEERSVMGIYSYSGTQLGTVLMLASSGVIASSNMGWPGIFYAPGTVGIIWCVIWYVWGASAPSECNYITIKERKLIETSLASNSANSDDKKNLKFPVKSALTSLPFIILIITHCSFSWGFWTLLTQIPNYMKNILKVDIKSNALLSAMPYFSKLIFGFVLSVVSKYIVKHNLMSLTTTRRLFNTLGFWIPAVALVVLGYIDAEYPITVNLMLNIIMGFNSAVYLGFVVNHIDLSPNFAGILMGITNLAANLHSMLAPIAVGRILTSPDDLNQWRIIFFIAAGYYLIGNLLFITLGSCEVQPWNNASQTAKLVPTSEEDAVKIELKEQKAANQDSKEFL